MSKEYMRAIKALKKVIKAQRELIDSQKELIDEQAEVIDKIQRAAWPEKYGEYSLGEAYSDLMTLKGTMV